MISLKSKQTIESKSIPGVTFTVRSLNKIQRAKRDLPVMTTRQQISLLVREYAPLVDIPEGERTPEQAKRMNAIDVEYTWLRDSVIKPSEIRGGLASIDGLEIDGKPATAESLIESAGADYDDLIDEIAEACEAAAGLSTKETKNSPSDTTSTAQVAPISTGSSATSAG